MKNKTIYRLTIEDIQEVAKDIYGKSLTDAQIEKVIDPIGDRISWVDAIDEAISNSLNLKRIEEEI